MLRGILHKRPSPSLIVSLMALVLATGGFAMAAIPDGNGVINGCYKKKKGTLRLVSSSKKCKKSERAISWNQKGQPGAAGAQGAAGQQGKQGEQGAQGAPGSAVAFARVRADGTVDEDQSRGLTDANFSKGITGAYCISNLSFTPRSMVATAVVNPFVSGSTDRIATVDVTPSNTSLGNCGFGTPVVEIYDVSSAALADGPFWVWFED